MLCVRKKNKGEKNTDSKRTGLFCVLHCHAKLVVDDTQWMQRHTTTHLENKKRKAFQWKTSWLGGTGLHTTSSTAQISLGGMLDVSSHLYGFSADLNACRLDCLCCGM